jgi:hypothetical protein
LFHDPARQTLLPELYDHHAFPQIANVSGAGARSDKSEPLCQEKSAERSSDLQVVPIRSEEKAETSLSREQNILIR